MPRFKVFVDYESAVICEAGPHRGTFPRVTGPVDVPANSPEEARIAAVRQVKPSAKDGIVWVSKIKKGRIDG